MQGQILLSAPLHLLLLKLSISNMLGMFFLKKIERTMFLIMSCQVIELFEQINNKEKMFQ